MALIIRGLTNGVICDCGPDELFQRDWVIVLFTVVRRRSLRPGLPVRVKDTVVSIVTTVIVISCFRKYQAAKFSRTEVPRT